MMSISGPAIIQDDEPVLPDLTATLLTVYISENNQDILKKCEEMQIILNCDLPNFFEQSMKHSDDEFYLKRQNFGPFRKNLTLVYCTSQKKPS